MAISFTPNPAKIPVMTAPNTTNTVSIQSEPLSSAASVGYSWEDDKSGGAISLLSLASFVYVTEIESSEGPHGPLKPVKIQVPQQQAQLTGASFEVASGQFLVATVQFAPTSSTPANSTATLVITSTPGDQVRIPISAVMGQLIITVDEFSVVQGASGNGQAKVKCVGTGGQIVFF